MEIVDSNDFYAKYPRYSEIEALKNADVLIMPNLNGYFSSNQMIFQNEALSTQINCLFYSEEPKSPHFMLRESVDPSEFLILGTLVFSGIEIILKFYEIFFKETKQDGMLNKPILSNNAVNISDNEIILFQYNQKNDELEERVRQIEIKQESIRNKKNRTKR